MADVSAKLLAQFVANLERDVLSEPAVDLVAAAAEDAAADAAPSAPAPAASGSTASASTDAALSGPPTSNGALKTEDGVTVRTIDSPEAAPVNLIEMGGTPVLQRLLPLVGIAVVLVLWRVWRRRRSAS